MNIIHAFFRSLTTMKQKDKADFATLHTTISLYTVVCILLSKNENGYTIEKILKKFILEVLFRGA